MRKTGAEETWPLRKLRVGVSFLVMLCLIMGACSDKKSTIPIDPGMSETDKDFLPAWSPDGKTVAYFTIIYDPVPFQTSLRTVSVDTDSISIIRELGNLDVHGLDWSPDGEWLVFSSVLGLFKIRASGDSLIQLTHGDYHAFPSWSTSSNQIFFAKNAGSERGLYSMQPDGSSLHRWTWPDSFVVEGPSCFPTSDSLTIYTYRGAQYCLGIHHPGDTNISAILECGFSWLESSRMSPDASWIAFNANYSGDPESNLYLYNRTDQTLEKLNTKASEGMDFSPDGSQLVHADLGVVYDDPRLADRRGSRGMQIITLTDRSVRQLTPGYH